MLRRGAAAVEQEHRGIDIAGGLVLVHVVDELDPGSHGLPAAEGPGQSAADAPPRPDRAVAPDERRRAVRLAGKRIGPIEGEPIEGGPERHARAAERAPVLRINQRVTIGRLLRESCSLNNVPNEAVGTSRCRLPYAPVTVRPLKSRRP